MPTGCFPLMSCENTLKYSKAQSFAFTKFIYKKRGPEDLPPPWLYQYSVLLPIIVWIYNVLRCSGEVQRLGFQDDATGKGLDKVLWSLKGRLV